MHVKKRNGDEGGNLLLVVHSRIFRRRRPAVHGCVAVVGWLKILVSSVTILGGYFFFFFLLIYIYR